MADYTGDSGDNIFTGGSEADNASGGAGDDQLSGNGDDDTLSGDAGADTLNGGDGEDWLYSAAKSPEFNLPYGSNPYTPPVLDTGSEVDTLIGGSGDDRLFAGYGDNVDGGTNSLIGDRIYISFQGAPSGVTADFGLASQVIGGGTITGIESVSWIDGSEFADTINARYMSGGYGDFTAVFGKGGNNSLTAGYYTKLMDGGAGDDLIDGRPSQYLSSLDGGAGNDTIYGGVAVSYGGDGDDTLHVISVSYGGAGNDLIFTAGGSAFGEDGDDQIQASASFSILWGGAGADTLTGYWGTDILSSSGPLPFPPNPYPTFDNDMGLEQDILTGGAGDDTLVIGYGDSADGGAGTDTLRFSFGGATEGVYLDTFYGISQALSIGGGTVQNIETLEYLRGSEFNDALIIATQASLLTIDGGAGGDLVVSQNSSVNFSGGAGADYFQSGAAGDVFDGGAGTDTLTYTSYASGVTVTLALVAGQTGTGAGGDQVVNVENVKGSMHGDTVTGNNDANWLQGYDGDDVLHGLGGDDSLDGGTGNDAMYGGAGDDLYSIEDFGDLVFEAADEGHDRLGTSVSYVLAAGQHIEELRAGGSVGISLAGNELNNLIRGTSASDVLDGGGGDDLLFGSSFDTTGLDTFIGGAGDDVIYVDDAGDIVVEAEGGGQDTVTTSVSYVLSPWIEGLWANGSNALVDLTGNASDNYINASSTPNVLYGLGGDDEINAYDGNDYLDGGSGADLMRGQEGNDYLDGGAGADEMSGGSGDDLYVVDNAGDVVVEGLGEGSDTVYALVSFTLSQNAQVEILAAGGADPNAPLGLTGSGFANNIWANEGANWLSGLGGNDSVFGFGGNDYLDGGTGADFMIGGTGDDVFVADDALDYALEYAGEGQDRLYAMTGFTLNAGSSIEILIAGGPVIAGGRNLTGNELANNIWDDAGDNDLYGAGGADALFGFGGADYLDGGTGADFLIGGTGDDIFVVDDSGDVVIEAAGEGSDKVYAMASFTLSAGSSIEILIAGGPVIAGGRNLTGNELANNIWDDAGDNDLYGADGADALFGFAGADYLDGGTGADFLVGGSGDDIHVVDDAGDVVVETAGEGSDTVYASADYALGAGQSVEILAAGGSGAVGLTGNELANNLWGNAANNALDGAGGNDAVFGFGGNDTLSGSAGSDLVVGGAGDDSVGGGDGADTLLGEAGADSFVFDTAFGGGIDTIGDFSAADDAIALDDAVFAGLTPGALAAAAFVAGTAAADADDRIIYDVATGALWFDADGNGAGAAMQFATLTGSPVLTAGDFLVI